VRNRRVGPAASAIVVFAALALPVSGGAARASVPAWTASQLAPLYVNSTGAAGSIDGEYGFRNRSTRRCGLRGFPKVQMLTRSGGALPTTEQHAPGAYGIKVKLVTLGRGSVAYFGLHYAAATGFANLSCPTSAALRLTAPGVAGGMVLHGAGGRIRPFGETTVHLHCGIVHVSAVSAKRFQ